MHAAEGDARLVGQSRVANWRIDSLELFFVGSSGPVCAGSFGAADARVACRSMDFRGGTIGPLVNNIVEPRQRLLYREVAVTSLGCTGQVANLLQCPGEMDIPADEYPYNGVGCFEAVGQPLVVACVNKPETGAQLMPFSYQTILCRFMRGRCPHLHMPSTQHVSDHCIRCL